MIEVKGLHKTFGRLKVLQGVDLAIPSGSITAVLGPNGSGKTTFIKSILGLVIPDKGEILWQGRSVKNQSHYRKQIGYLPQIARFPENLKVNELLDMVADLRQQPANKDALIDSFKLGPFMNKRLRHLSGGTRQKVNTILTFMFDSDLYILDEPTAGLDPVALIKLKELIADRQQQSKTILFTTHIMSLVEELADQIIFLLEGKVYFQGPVSELKNICQERSLERAIAKILERKTEPENEPAKNRATV